MVERHVETPHMLAYDGLEGVRLRDHGRRDDLVRLDQLRRALLPDGGALLFLPRHCSVIYDRKDSNHRTVHIETSSGRFIHESGLVGRSVGRQAASGTLLFLPRNERADSEFLAEAGVQVCNVDWSGCASAQGDGKQVNSRLSGSKPAL